jgi:hypothetical protein
MKKIITATILILASISFAGWFTTEYWVIASETMNSPTIVQLKTESKSEAINYANRLVQSNRYGAVNVGIGPCRLQGGMYGIYVCSDVIFRHVNW